MLDSRMSKTQDTDFGAEHFIGRRWGVEVSLMEQVQGEWQLVVQVRKSVAEEMEVSKSSW